MLLTQNRFYLHQKEKKKALEFTETVTSYTQECLLMISFHVRRQTFIQLNTFSFTDTVSTVCIHMIIIYDSILHITKNSKIKLNHTMVIPFVFTGILSTSAKSFRPHTMMHHADSMQYLSALSLSHAVGRQIDTKNIGTS